VDALRTPSPNIDVRQLLDLLPTKLIDFVEQKSVENLIEIVLDLGRNPEFRFKALTVYHVGMIVDREMIDSIVNSPRITGFGRDNRAGIQNTLHRVSCIRSRSGDVVGLTMRVGMEISSAPEAFRNLHINNSLVLLTSKVLS
jgi:stage III sporulation protein SpoIIIAA